MKYPIWIVLGLFYAGASVARAQDEGGPLLSPVELDLQNANTDDQLIKLARAAKINVMADASDWPADGKVAGRIGGTALTVAKKQTLLEWLRDIAYTNRLTWERNEHNGGNTVVLWPEPDIVPTARRIVDEALKERPQLEAEARLALHDKLDPALVAQLDAEPAKWPQALQQYGLLQMVVTDPLRTLLQEKYGWDGQNQDLHLELKEEQIPAELRSHIILYRRLLQAYPNSIYPSAWLRNETWQKARLVVRQPRPSMVNGKMQPLQWVLSVVASVNGREDAHIVAILSTEDGGDQ